VVIAVAPAFGDCAEEVVDELARLLAAVEPAPPRSQAADELIAGVDRDQVALGRRVDFRIFGNAHQQCLNVVGQQADPRFSGADRAPGVQVELGFGCTGRARVETDSAIQRRIAEEERQADRNL